MKGEVSWGGLGRLVLVAGAAAYALGPYLGPRFCGAGDAYDYLLQVAGSPNSHSTAASTRSEPRQPLPIWRA